MNRFEGFSTCTKYALDYTCDYCQISLTSTQKAGLLNEYKVLPAFSDVKECFPKIINAGHRLFASGNPFDVIGALSYGMKSAWAQRTKETIWDPWTYEPTVTINQLTELHPKISTGISYALQIESHKRLHMNPLIDQTIKIPYIDEFTRENWDRILAVDLNGLFYCSQAVFANVIVVY